MRQTLKTGRTGNWSTPEEKEDGHLVVESDTEISTLHIQLFKAMGINATSPRRITSGHELDGQTVPGTYPTEVRLTNLGPTEAHVDVRWASGAGTKRLIATLATELAG